jgi:hypothetical protein
VLGWPTRALPIARKRAGWHRVARSRSGRSLLPPRGESLPLRGLSVIRRRCSDDHAHAHMMPRSVTLLPGTVMLAPEQLRDPRRDLGSHESPPAHGTRHERLVFGAKRDAGRDWLDPTSLLTPLRLRLVGHAENGIIDPSYRALSKNRLFSLPISPSSNFTSHSSPASSSARNLWNTHRSPTRRPAAMR